MICVQEKAKKDFFKIENHTCQKKECEKKKVKPIHQILLVKIPEKQQQQQDKTN